MAELLARVAGEPAGPLPVVAQVFGQTARLCGVPVGAYGRDGEVLARCQLEGLRRYGHDAVFALADSSVEPEAMGVPLRMRTDDYPYVATPAPMTPREVLERPLPDPRIDGRMPVVLAAAHRLRREVGEDALVTGCVLGPMTLVTQLLGIEAGLYLAADDPALFEQMLDRATEVALRFGAAQVEAGAHLPLVFDPASTPTVVPPAFFRELVAPRLTRLLAGLARAGAAAGWFHVAGDSRGILPDLPGTGAHIVNVDYEVPLTEAAALAPGVCIEGNVRPALLAVGTPDEVERSARAAVQAMAGHPAFILSSGCEVPLEAPPENVAALVRAAR